MAELIRRGHGVEKIGQVLLADVNGCVVFFKQAYTSLFSNTASKLISNKFATKIVLEANGINVARGGIYSSSSKNDAWKMAESLGSSVIKPFNGARGKGVSVGIKSKAGFESAWKYAGGDEGRSILVEEEFFGEEARYLVVGGQCIAIYKKAPPVVVGDGASTVRELFDEKNATRQRHPHFARRLIKLTESREAYIRSQGFTFDSVPEKGTLVYIDNMASISAGGETHEITESVHPGMKRVAEIAARSVPDGDILGVDIMAKSHANPPDKSNYIVVEINAQPGLGGHQKPLYGTPKDAVSPIINNVEKEIERRGEVKAIWQDHELSESDDYQAFSLADGLGEPIMQEGRFQAYKRDDSTFVTYKGEVYNACGLLRKPFMHKVFLRKMAIKFGFDLVPGEYYSISQKSEAEFFSGSLLSPCVSPFHGGYSDVKEGSAGADFEEQWERALLSEKNQRKPLVKGVFVSPEIDVKGEVRATVAAGKVLFCCVKEDGGWLPHKLSLKGKKALRKLASSLPYLGLFEVFILVGSHGENEKVYLSGVSFDVSLEEYSEDQKSRIYATQDFLAKCRFESA